ncbi:DUF4214 domain-containing protein [Salinarimonas ramus]|uniref:DUF4214 domain-containing protein n=1 Tax=Salinarimonas ramus TaxID=690164 RepID=A0A917Q3Q7_9HYPH|nr:DUF4214 domain-containing protein [Salinarimonas ramus]GGK18195.1 hypothetical protein GCM10011322_01140 [Salinarimonas ramus]
MRIEVVGTNVLGYTAQSLIGPLIPDSIDVERFERSSIAFTYQDPAGARLRMELRGEFSGTSPETAVGTVSEVVLSVQAVGGYQTYQTWSEIGRSLQDFVVSNLGSLLAGDDTFLGGALADTAHGATGRDVFVGRGGDDTFFGGEGTDTATFTGLRDAYVVTRSADRLVVADTAPTRDGTDTLLSVERLQFSDGILAFDTAGTAGAGYRLYQAAFARAPDAEGLGFWVRALDQGMALRDAAAAFITSAEFQQKYGTSVSDAAFVDALYQNVLGRSPDEGGAAYWQGELARGLARADALVSFSESPENVALVAPSTADGIWLL